MSRKHNFHPYISKLHVFIIKLLFHFKHPINDDMLNFGGILNVYDIYMYLIRLLSLLFFNTILLSLIISLIPHISLFLHILCKYLWYLHSHFICTKLSIYEFFINKLLPSIIFWFCHFYYTIRETFFTLLITKSFLKETIKKVK